MLAEAQPAGEVRVGAGHMLAITGLPFSFLNVLVVTAAPEDAAGLLESTGTDLAARGLPWSVRARGPAASVTEGAARAAGLAPHGVEVAMVLDPLAELIAATSHTEPMLTHRRPRWRADPAVTIEEVCDESLRARYVAVLALAYRVDERVMASLLPPALLFGGGLRGYLGSHEETPAAASALVITSEVAGVYNVGTVPTLRRLGLGTAMTHHALTQGRAAGCSIGTLQATRAGQGIYTNLGFRPVDTWYQWAAGPVGP